MRESGAVRRQHYCPSGRGNNGPARRECAEIYKTVETRIPLGSDFETGKMYTVEVNDVTET